MRSLYELNPARAAGGSTASRAACSTALREIFSRHPGQYITTILVGNNIALVIYSLCMSLLLCSESSPIGWESVVREGPCWWRRSYRPLIIIFAEFLPKSVFKQNPNFYYRALAPVIFGFYLLLYPLARFTTLLRRESSACWATSSSPGPSRSSSTART